MANRTQKPGAEAGAAQLSAKEVESQRVRPPIKKDIRARARMVMTT